MSFYDDGDTNFDQFNYEIYDPGKILHDVIDFNYSMFDHPPYKGCDKIHKCLPEKIIWWFLDEYNDRLQKSLTGQNIDYYHDGLIILDSPKGIRYNSTPFEDELNITKIANYYNGIEMRIYNAHTKVKYIFSYFVSPFKKIYFIDNVMRDAAKSLVTKIDNSLINELTRDLIKYLELFSVDKIEYTHIADTICKISASFESKNPTSDKSIFEHGYYKNKYEKYKNKYLLGKYNGVAKYTGGSVID